MPLYKCEIVRVEYMKATITVEAEDEYGAEQAANEEVADDDFETMNADQHGEYVERVDDKDDEEDDDGADE